MRVSAVPPAGLVMFLVPAGAGARRAARLRRAGRGPCGVSLPDDPPGIGWVSAHNPSPALLAEAAGPGSPVEAFAEQVPGGWVRHGWRHLLPDYLVRQPGQVLLLRPPRSVAAVPGEVPVPEADDFRLPVARPRRPSAAPAAPAVPVRFHL